MEFLTFLLAIVAIVFGILQVILFFKVWGMTDDVRKLTHKFCESQQSEQQQTQTSAQTEKELQFTNEKYDLRLDKVMKGDKVRRIYDGKLMEVADVSPGRIFCKGSLLEGFKWYPKSALEFVGNP